MSQMGKQNMIKKIVFVFLKYKIWLTIIVVLDIMFGIFLWLIDAYSFTRIFGASVLGSLGLYSAAIFVVFRLENRKAKAIMDFLENPDFHQEEIAAGYVTGKEKSVIHLIGERLREKDQRIKEQDMNLLEYEEYIEIWAHEIKNPLALMTLVLDNRRDEVSPIVYHRLEYISTQMQEDVERMLYYARLKSAHTDYLFTNISLSECCRDLIEEYGILLQEGNINIIDEVENLQVISDHKGLNFLIRQVISNSIKYRKADESHPFIHLSTGFAKESGDIILIIRDNGIGVKTYDLPFLFDKGFTGDIGAQRNTATGMGLYLAKQIADHLKIRIEVSEEYIDGFEIWFLFPSVSV